MASSRTNLVAAALSVALLVACGSQSPGTSSQISPSPSATPTLDSIAAQPGDLPAVAGLKICRSSALNDPSGNLGQWQEASAAGAVDSWWHVLRLDCTKGTGKEVANLLARFADAAAANAFFAREKANVLTADNSWWPLNYEGGTVGSATGFGDLSVVQDGRGGHSSVHGILWIHANIAAVYLVLALTRDDLLKGAHAVDARITG